MNERGKGHYPLPDLGRLLYRVECKGRSVLRAVAVHCIPLRVRALACAMCYRGHSEEDNSQVTVYCAAPSLFAGFPRRAPLNAERGLRSVGVTLVVTARNERDNANEWLDSLLHQTRLPDEVIIVDGGSTDGTVDVLLERSAEAPFGMRVIAMGDVNIARGRNVGIEQASHPVVANTDMGCQLDPHWLEYLTRPFEINGDTEVAAGWYVAAAETAWAEAAAIEFTRDLDEIDPQTFLPSGRSIAFRREAWQAVGGYPEWLSRTAEDTYFGLELKRFCHHWAFVPEAVVHWQAPSTLRASMVKAYGWSHGDGEAALFPRRQRWAATRAVGGSFLVLLGSFLLLLWPWAVWLGLSGIVVLLLASLFILRLARKRGVWRRCGGRLSVALRWVVAVFAVQCAAATGYVSGVLQRPATFSRRLGDARGLAFVLSGVPMDDSGGGQRATQLALELLRRSYLVVFLHKFPRQESVSLRIRHSHRDLLAYPLACFDWRSFLKQQHHALVQKPLLAVVEFPLRDFLPLLQEVRARDGRIIYDLIDDWTTSLGGHWYSWRAERAIIEVSHALTATAHTLQSGLMERSGRPVALVPNAVNPAVFSRTMGYEWPVDLPPGAFVICYVGKLWGEWMDWALLRAIALAYPKASVAIIGDYRGQCPNPPPNLHFLGLKPQTAIPGYLAHADVAIIPWRINAVTKATNPVKIYEYLAMGRSVVAPRLRSLEGIPYVFLSDSEEEFIANIDCARRVVTDDAVVDSFIERNSWCQRASMLLDLAKP